MELGLGDCEYYFWRTFLQDSSPSLGFRERFGHNGHCPQDYSLLHNPVESARKQGFQYGVRTVLSSVMQYLGSGPVRGAVKNVPCKMRACSAKSRKLQ